MDKLAKALAKLSPKEKVQVKEILGKLIQGKMSGLDVRRLKGAESVFCIRKGSLRIIYQNRGGGIFILAIERRREDTYKGL
ncbi:hypothetical protein A3C91_01145 [Candidatus Azambacteria bacterium RIFCSPHIGHO2_02_FULL_52_12]|uniref:Plasmid stabilization protein n=1 Tax=Candidatus Azambacteria bacterium RIFCSPLOWO2_01_FULL_46_25 TaxID=1797298 RepID=A0A1F5BUA7_9BACT|nr:MAG: hypothetical protein A3C91_01145 [Candidatus Azambacteria bacterium RIFCSPHIGHO2_02_FULL_52_12]OGD34177.1 MAG: hypothetical protein A2988_01720 [Candidatus Azambacteria bacterium RIFCSPLOWO2_01_FULL_46_25]OGD37220.1 MAG: hypothetical protein A2850_00075 [Candidatus Azambacteria bacterium RIFCSPHIGHO2_01_FULL_51_74]